METSANIIKQENDNNCDDFAESQENVSSKNNLDSKNASIENNLKDKKIESLSENNKFITPEHNEKDLNQNKNSEMNNENERNNGNNDLPERIEKPKMMKKEKKIIIAYISIYMDLLYLLYHLS